MLGWTIKNHQQSKGDANNILLFNHIFALLSNKVTELRITPYGIKKNVIKLHNI